MGTVQTQTANGNVLVLTLDKPPANAIDEALLGDLARALDGARANDAVRAVVVRGAGDFFCAGFDFAVPRRDDQVSSDMYALYRDAHVKLLGLPKPTVAMLNGHTIAGGLVIALACDFRIAHDGDYRVGVNEVAIGASYPRAAAEIMHLRLTHAQASELMLGATLYPASEAPRLGIANQLVPSANLEEAVIAHATHLAAHPRQSYAHTKHAMVAPAIARIQAETDAEALQTMAVWISEETRTARRRQREKLGVTQGA